MQSRKKWSNPISAQNKINIKCPTANIRRLFNGEEINTSRIAADLLSPKICLYHRINPTMDKFINNTECRGHFSHILDLVKFDEISIPANEYLFFIEVLEILVKFWYATCK